MKKHKKMKSRGLQRAEIIQPQTNIYETLSPTEKYEIERKRKLKYFIYVVGLALILSSIFYVINKYDENNSEEMYLSASLKKVPDNEVWVISREFVKPNLKAPSTAEFPFEDVWVSSKADTYTVIAPVDAQNSFGAMLRSKYKCILVYTGGKTHQKENWINLGVIIE